MDIYFDEWILHIRDHVIQLYGQSLRVLKNVKVPLHLVDIVAHILFNFFVADWLTEQRVTLNSQKKREQLHHELRTVTVC